MGLENSALEPAGGVHVTRFCLCRQGNKWKLALSCHLMGPTLIGPGGVINQFTYTLMLRLNDCAFYTVMFDLVQSTANDGILIDDVCLNR